MRRFFGKKLLRRVSIISLLVTALSALRILLAEPSVANVSDCAVFPHCAEIMYSAEKGQFRGLDVAMQRAHLYSAEPTPGDYYINSEIWFQSHCTAGSTWVESGLTAGNIQGFGVTGYASFYADGKYVNNQLQFYHEYHVAELSQDGGRQFVSIFSNGDGTSTINNGSWTGTSDNVGLTLGSCLQQGGEVYSPDADAATFDMYGHAWSNSGNEVFWPSGVAITTHPGMHGVNYSNSEWSWNTV